MELEEREGVEGFGTRCQVCGAELTADEKAAVLESETPPLCKIHAAEELPDAADEEPVG